MTGFTLPGMIEEPGWVSGRRARRGPRAAPCPSAGCRGDLPQAERDRPQRAVRGDARVERGLGVEVVRRFADRQPVSSDSRAQARAAYSGWALIPVPTAVPPSGTVSSSSRAAWARRIGLLDLTGIPRELLAEPDRGRVLEMGPAGLDDRPELVGLRGQRLLEADERRDQLLLDRERAGSWSAVGIVSLEDWHRLTSSLGWTRRPSPGRLAERAVASEPRTSFMFVLVEVPEPVW